MNEQKMFGKPEAPKMFDENGLPTGLEDKLMNPPLEDYEKAPDELGDEYQSQQEDQERERQARELLEDEKWDKQMEESGKKSLEKWQAFKKLAEGRELTQEEKKEMEEWENDLKTHWPELLKNI